MLVRVWTSAKYFATCQDVRLSSEAPDPFSATYEIGKDLCTHTFEFILSGRRSKKLLYFLVDTLFDLLQIAAGLGRRLNDKETSDLTLVEKSTNVSCDLLVVDQAFVESRRLIRNKHV